MTIGLLSANKVIATAEGTVGYREGRDPDGNWNNIEKFAAQVPGLAWANGQAWCAVWMSWVARTAGVANLYPRTASCNAAYAWFKQHAHVSSYPAIGAQIFFGSNGDMHHTGLVRSYDANNVYTAEGNTNIDGSPQGNGVYNLKHGRRDSWVQAYGYPNFPEGIQSADPAWAKGHL